MIGEIVAILGKEVFSVGMHVSAKLLKPRACSFTGSLTANSWNDFPLISGLVEALETFEKLLMISFRAIMPMRLLFP